MDNHTISKHFSFLSRLMDVHGENSFKSKSYSIAAYKIDQLTADLETLPDDKIYSLNGIGDAIGKKIIELKETGSMKILDDLIAETPPGILEMMKLKGLGPKKISLIWKEMEIENLGELLYACHENRLELMKGFGKKTQQNVIEAIEFYQSHQGNFLYAQVESLAEELASMFRKVLATDKVQVVGNVAMHEVTIQDIAFVIEKPEEEIAKALTAFEGFKLIDRTNDILTYQYHDGVQVKIYSSGSEKFLEKIILKTGDQDFIDELTARLKTQKIKVTDLNSEEEVFIKAKLQFIPAYLRHGKEILDLAAKTAIPETIKSTDIRGIIHSHSNWSDGSNTLQEMAEACIERGLEYLVISDHSKSAFYAQGLNEDRLKAQHDLIDELNQKLKPFKIFKSIESDILNDGSLDYSDSVLKTFDLVIASVHSNLKMSEEKAMARLLKTIENPYTTILGHMTGRLLLSRKGYPVNHHEIIDACAANNVVIEINAHPRRLDMSWEFIPYAISKNVLLSIDPDAHSTGEFDNVKYGVLAAQKGMLTAKNNLSSYSLNEFETFLEGYNKKRK